LNSQRAAGIGFFNISESENIQSQFFEKIQNEWWLFQSPERSWGLREQNGRKSLAFELVICFFKFFENHDYILELRTTVMNPRKYLDNGSVHVFSNHPTLVCPSVCWVVLTLFNNVQVWFSIRVLN
jgi:hypothetical protein